MSIINERTESMMYQSSRQGRQMPEAHDNIGTIKMILNNYKTCILSHVLHNYSWG